MIYAVFVFALACFVWQMYVYLGYIRQLYLPAPTSQLLDMPCVSIIIAARNEAKNLPNLLDALIQQDYPKEQYEIIIINDRSQDDTPIILEEYAKKHTYIHIISIAHTPEGISPKKYALQKGIAQSSFDWLLLTDADCIMSSHWVRTMMQARKDIDTKIVLGIAPLIPDAKHKNSILQQFIQFETLYTALQYMGFASGGKPYMGVGRNLLYHKSLFEQIGGFDAFMHITGGDDDLFINCVATKKNTSLAFLESTFVYSPAPANWNAWLLQKKRHLSVGKYYRLQDQMRLAGLYASQGGIWISALWALGNLPTSLAIWIWVLFGVRSLKVWYDYVYFAKKFDCKVSLPCLLLFDGIFVGYLFGVGSMAYFSKRIRWKV